MLTVGRIETEGVRNQVSALIYRMYVKDGYIRDGEPSPFISYLEKDTTVTFGAYVAEELIGTVSLIPHSAALPMNVLFKEELELLTGDGKVIGEVCQFVVDKEHAALTDANIVHTEISTELLAAVCHYGITKSFHGFCLAVNPKHAPFYHHIGCIQIGEEKTYSLVQNAPAIPFYFDLELIQNTSTTKNFLLNELEKRIRKRREM